jgi:hypothetical protein
MRARGPSAGTPCRRTPVGGRKSTRSLKPKLLAAATSDAVQQPQVLAGPLADFEVTLNGRICGDHRGTRSATWACSG